MRVPDRGGRARAVPPDPRDTPRPPLIGVARCGTPPKAAISRDGRFVSTSPGTRKKVAYDPVGLRLPVGARKLAPVAIRPPGSTRKRNPHDYYLY